MSFFPVFAGKPARLVACALLLAGGFVVSGCQSIPPAAVAERRPALLVMENLAGCAWRIEAIGADKVARRVAVPIGETVRLDLPGGTYEITQEALMGVEAGESIRRFAMPVAAGETYHWRLVTLTAVRRELVP